jgi:hypothetical protein
MGGSPKELSLVRIFLAPRVLTLPELSDRLGRSRSTALRRLKEHRYYTSYNDRGKFMTIEEVAGFDSKGLWVCKGARFSRRGTLKDTLHHFVQTSTQGMTHEELATLLGLRVHDTLLDLVREGAIRRRRLGPTFVYCSSKRSVEKEQTLRRKEFLEKRQRPHATSRQRIATLLELITDPKVRRQDIVLRCRRAGVRITRELVDTIFEEYELDKKRAPSRPAKSCGKKR